MKSRISKLLIAGALLAIPSITQAATLFRFPMSMLSGQCANGGCVVSAYKDLGGTKDWACGPHTYTGHTGTDYALSGGFGQMDAGTWIISAAGGVIESRVDGFFDRCTYWNKANNYADCGIYAANYIVMKHADNRRSKYWHLKKFTHQYAQGASVPCGNWIAQTGSSGASTGPHLHFEFWDPSWGTDDPYAAVSGCGGTVSLWTSQGGYKGLPGITCQ